MANITLGTVQFGLKYGINNKDGKPSLKKSLEMLNLAFDQGIDTFDTAQSYGDAEEILGRFIADRKIADKVKIISKLRPNILDEETADSMYNIVKWELEKALKRLNVKCLEGYLFHTPAYIYNEKLVEAMKACKKDGLIKNFGVSIYEEADALYAVEKAGVDYIQVPYSVFDQRMDKSSFFKKAKENNVRVFARSAFLQGLILMDSKDVPDHLSEAREYLDKFDQIIKKHNYSRSEAAFLFSLSHSGISDVVFGVDSGEQLLKDVTISKNNVENFATCLEELKNSFSEIKKSIIFPSLWKKD